MKNGVFEQAGAAYVVVGLSASWVGENGGGIRSKVSGVGDIVRKLCIV